jgi:hypothetical protein
MGCHTSYTKLVSDSACVTVRSLTVHGRVTVQLTVTAAVTGPDFASALATKRVVDSGRSAAAVIGLSKLSS